MTLMALIAICLAAIGGATLGWTAGLGRHAGWRDVAAAALLVMGIALAPSAGIPTGLGAFVMAIIAAEAVTL